jgi:hypothetical protein
LTEDATRHRITRIGARGEFSCTPIHTAITLLKLVGLTTATFAACRHAEMSRQQRAYGTFFAAIAGYAVSVPDEPAKSRPLADLTIQELLAMSGELRRRAAQIDEDSRQLASEIAERHAKRQDRPRGNAKQQEFA